MKKIKEICPFPDKQIQAIIKAVCDGDLCAREIAAGQRPYRERFSIRSMEKLNKSASDSCRIHEYNSHERHKNQLPISQA